MTGKTSDAQRASSSRYRERNKEELRRKARERMAKRRAKLKESEEAWSAYTAKAREESARYRKLNARDLALNQATRRAKSSMEKHGFKAWHAGYLKRHPRPPQVEEDLPEWPEGEPRQAAPDRPPPPPASASYEEELNYFLDYLDPTMAPDYVPQAGEKPFFQRSKTRWE
ncbi:hypothetical protein C8R46DRAFT_1228073 [Mycena filopes]|nr:hypothetical protein C8R46DRAFT_1228073 [Mycena filopes]